MNCKGLRCAKVWSREHTNSQRRSRKQLLGAASAAKLVTPALQNEAEVVIEKFECVIAVRKCMAKKFRDLGTHSRTLCFRLMAQSGLVDMVVYPYGGGSVFF
jgi:hypothetical protein